MTTSSAEHGAHRRVSRVLLIDLVVPLLLFYGLRWLGVNQFVALLAGAVIPTVGTVRSIAVERRVSGVRIFVLAAMTLTVAISFITGSPRVLLVRSAWLMVALGVFLLITVRARRPFRYETTRILLTEHQQLAWVATRTASPHSGASCGCSARSGEWPASSMRASG